MFSYGASASEIGSSMNKFHTDCIRVLMGYNKVEDLLADVFQDEPSEIDAFMANFKSKSHMTVALLVDRHCQFSSHHFHTVHYRMFQ